MSLEGELQVRLRLKAGRITAVAIGSSRPDIAQTLLQGRHADDVLAAVPRLFSVCAASQATASRLAIAAARGTTPDAGLLAQAEADVAAETVRESAWQALLHMPRWMGASPRAEDQAAARAAMAWRDAATADADPSAGEIIASAVFGCSASAWLGLPSLSAIAGWAAAGPSASARFMHRLAAAGADDPDAPATPLLPSPQRLGLAALAAQACADPSFSRQPIWQGRPAETGALARLQDDPVIGQGAPPAPSRLWARHAARLRELALLLAGHGRPNLGALAMAPGSAVAWVDNARGLLVHHVRLDGEAVQAYRIIAPTEWNFHPQGALATALQGAPAANAEAARQLALRLIHSLDPCVNCQVDVDHA